MDAAIEVPLPDERALRAILSCTLNEYGTVYPPLARLAEAPGLASVAAKMIGMDGRSARKLITNAAARRLETAMSPAALTVADLLGAATGRSESEADDVAA